MAKKYLLLLLILGLSACYIQGQTKDFKPGWDIGVGFGPTFATVDFQTGKNYERLTTKNRQQFYGGLAIRYISEKNLGFILEVNYSQQGWEEDFKTEEVKDKQFFHSHQLNYLEVPFLTHIYFGNKVRFVFNLGPKLSYLLSENEEMNDALKQYLANGEANSYTVTHQYFRKADRKIDYAIMAGLGIELRTGIGNFMLEGRYTFGLGDIYNNSKADYFTRSANRVIGAKLTYYVKLF